MSEKSDEEKFYPTKASFGDVYLLGLAIKLGGCVASWHNGFEIGFWPYFVCYLIVGSGYLALTLCVAEMISVISFPGGYYGYVRCGMGPLLGFLVGCSGLVESVFFLAVSVLKIGQVFTVAFHMDTSFQPIIWFAVYSIIILFHARGSRLFWQVMKLCTVFSLAIILLYLFGSMPVLNFNKYAEPHHRLEFHTSVTDFLHMLRLPGWFFMGIDMVSLTVEEVNHSKEVVPWSMVSVISTMIVLTFWLFMTVASQSPGVTTEMYQLTSIFPLSFGFSRMLNIPESTASLFTLLPLLCSCTGYMFAVGRQLSSMARSGLFAPIFKRTVGADKVPMNAMLAGAISGLLGLFFAWQYDPYTMLFRLAMLGGSVVYVNLFACFLVFKTRYCEMERGCRNPCGYASAVYGMIVFSFVFIALARDTSNVFIITAYGSFMLLMWLYYYAYAEAHQFFSEKEQTVFLKAYIVNLNRRKKMAMAHKLAYDVVATYRFWERCAVWSRCSAMFCLRLVACCFCCHKNHENKRTAVYIQTTVSTQSNSNCGSLETSDKRLQGLEDGGMAIVDRFGVEPVTENLELDMAVVAREDAPSIDRGMTTRPMGDDLRNTLRAKETSPEDPDDHQQQQQQQQQHPTFRFHWKPLPRVAEQPASSSSSSYVSQEMHSHSAHVSALLAMKQTPSGHSSVSSSPSKLLSLNRLPGDVTDESPSRFTPPPIHTGHGPLSTNNTSPPMRSIDLATLSLDEETLSAQRQQQRPLFRAYTPTSTATTTTTPTVGVLRSRSPVHHPPDQTTTRSAPSHHAHGHRDPDSFHPDIAMSHSTDISDFYPPLRSPLRSPLRRDAQPAHDGVNTTPPLDHDNNSIAVERPRAEDPSCSGSSPPPPTQESTSIP